MTAPAPIVRGWCPNAWTPMAAGDGLLLRVRPPLARLTRARILAMCNVARRHGNGLLDLTNRAAIQIRGVGADYEDALGDLVAAGLVDRDPMREGGPAVLVAPNWRAGDDTHRIATALLDRIGDLPPLPAKVGIAIDAGATSMLGDTPSDFRIERGTTGALILRADGHATGVAVPVGGELAAIMALAEWFVASGGAEAGRMARHHVPLPSWVTGDVAPATSPDRLRPGPHPLGAAIGLPFGRIDATQLGELVADDRVQGVRITPWRIAIVESAANAPPADLRLLLVDACVGAPACPQGSVPTRALAEALAPLVAGSLHVSGCAKGCARARPADVVLTGRDGRFDLAFSGRAGATPAVTGLTPDQLVARFESRPMSPPARTPHIYETDGAAIYRRSFAIIRAEADLARFPPDEEPVAVRMIHATGMVGLAPAIRFSPGFVGAARAALAAGAPILCDARMVSEGITRARLPADNAVLCTLHAPEVVALAARMGTTRSAAALELWRPHLGGAVVAIGNAPTALFHLLDMLADPACPRPAAIIGCPVGFVGAVESKDALWAEQPVPCTIVAGRLGGSAITVAAVNALASRAE